ncbi:MAG TPA: endonuclease III [Thermodesulfobacteriota bacterium]|nr:endonuclease III [Deltaproteobacteria bacterium]HNU72544.1 endonuclease III [Thermodesulfobacteriota bacterium]
MSEKNKQPFSIDVVLERIRDAVQPFQPAALFQLAKEGYATLFEQLIACIISIRTLDTITLVAARRLFDRGRTAEAIAALDRAEIEALLRPSTFYQAKAESILDVARQTVSTYGGSLPCETGILMSFKGVEPKCANLALGIACGKAAIALDTHVHRITNRWGYIHTMNTAQSLAALEHKLPPQYWIELNRLLVPFGKHICTARRPKCSSCPVLSMCRQCGITDHR